MRRIALYSDIHGNTDALDAVFADMARCGVSERVCLGDLVGYGADPAGVIAMVRDSGDVVIQGNYDRGVGGRLGDCGCYYATAQARSDGEASYEYTVRAVGEVDAAWLASLPESVTVEHEGARILYCHGSPRRVNEYLLPDRTDSQLTRLAEQADADLVCVGHVHLPYHRVPSPGIHYVSSGSVGKPKDGDPRAGWVELVLGSASDVATTGDPQAGRVGDTDVHAAVVVHRVEYDIAAQISAMAKAGLPHTLMDALAGA
jgi:predicted phosphodiesterase